MKTVFRLRWHLVAGNRKYAPGWYSTSDDNSGRALRPVGFSSTTFGVYNITHAPYIAPGGIAPPPQTGPNSQRLVPDPTVDLRTKYLYPSGIAEPVNQFPTHYVAFYYQFIDIAGQAYGPETVGTALVADRIRYVYPSFIASYSSGTATVGRTSYIVASGFGGESIPITHDAEDFSNKVRTISGASPPTAYGAALVRNQRDIVYPDTSAWYGSIVNFPVVYNLRQIVTTRQFQNTDSDPAKYGQLTIENRNQTLSVFGHQDSRFGFYAANVFNNAAAASPAGLDATRWGNTLVAYRNRLVSPAGFDSFYTYGTIVFNAARVVGAQGINYSATGVPLVFNRNRTIYQYFPHNGETFGVSFTAYRVRSVAPNVFNDIPAGLPEVRFNPHPIAPQGIDSYRTGGTDVIHHRNTVSPFAVNVWPSPRIGTATVVNRNRATYTFGYEYGAFGRHSVEGFIREVFPTSITGGYVGATDISYRTKTLAAAAFSSHSVSVFAQVRNVIPDPPGQQYILPPSIVSEAWGVATLNYMTIFPTSFASWGFGSTKVRSTSLAPSWVFDDYVGVPTMVATQFLYPKYTPSNAAPGVGDSDLFNTKHRVSPHTIYAPSADQATAQAKQNNGFGAEIIDIGLWNTPPYHFGEASVSNKNRAIAHYHTLDSQGTTYGTPSVTLRTRRVCPFGSRFVRFGAHSLNGAQEILTNGFEVTHDFGSATVVGAYTSPYVYPSGFDASDYGRPDVDNFNRTVHPAGYEQTTFGSADVGPPRRLEVVGFVATRWGDAMVSYRNRFIHPRGFSAFLSSDHLPGFNDRMRVRLATPTPPTPIYPP